MIQFDDLKNREVYYCVHKNFSLNKPIQKILIGKYYDRNSPSPVEIIDPNTKQCYDMEEKENYYANREDKFFKTRKGAIAAAIKMLKEKIEELKKEKTC